ncbi:class I SAM-dependent methyltransferase [Aegicerativicinus sediminis]|uniref:class I SAM-dependent methyltransferase n=1 Tax=Aegicerativicinus sediminis TaxID=2893202 RepID=UPI001E3A23D7|nr:class I SAM-dependent methyltransferase [Aegicerativicinus sediminis]
MLLNSEIQEFIHQHLNDHIRELIFQKSPFEDVSMQEIVEQIDGKNRIREKLPTWYNTEGIYYPPKLNIEQSSSELTADYKSKLVEGKTLLDLTSGFGVDDFYFSNRFTHVFGCEINEGLSQIVNHNFSVLNRPNIQILNISAEAMLESEDYGKFDVVYIDPGRRDGERGKIVRLEDCYPNVIGLLPDIWRKTSLLVIKTSPLLDVTEVIRSIEGVKEVHCISIDNDMKELIFVTEKGFIKEPKIIAKDLIRSPHLKLEFAPTEEINAVTKVGAVDKFLYEPYSSLMKSGGFKTISHRWGLNKLNQNTHLYTSSEHIEFPGRKFEILEVLPYHKKALRSKLPDKANIATRNFPISVKELRKSFKISDGGTTYLFFTTNCNDQKVVLVTAKV